MREITVNVNELLEILQKNLKQHKSIYEKALIGFRKQAIDQFTKAIDDIKEGKITYVVQLDKPMDQSKVYERAILMLTMHTGKEIELSEEEFKNYVQDEWRWSSLVTETNSKYIVEEI